MISFSVHLIPVATPRHRSFRDRGGSIRHYNSPEYQKTQSEWIALADPHAPAKPLDGPIRLDLVFVMPLPKSAPVRDYRLVQAGQAVYHMKKPDNDNLEKMVKDALTRSGRFWRDDSQVCVGTKVKLYGSTPETRVTIRPLHQGVRSVASVTNELLQLDFVHANNLVNAQAQKLAREVDERIMDGS